MPITAKLRKYILERDNYTCAICHKQFPATKLEVDHIQPQSRNGTDDPSNLQILCTPHNRRKYNWEPIRSHTDENELKFKDFLRWFSLQTIHTNSPGLVHSHHLLQDIYFEYTQSYWNTYKRVRHFKTGCFHVELFTYIINTLGFPIHKDTNLVIGLKLRPRHYPMYKWDPAYNSHELPLSLYGPPFPFHTFDPITRN